jgi:large subunit ribosomal protein L25
MDFTLNAKTRDMDQNAKTLRKQGHVPGCVYGKNMEPIHVQIPRHKLQACLKKHVHKLNLDVEGQGTFYVGVEDVQKGHLGDELTHISFKNMNKNEKTWMTIEIHLEGKAKGQTEGGMINHLVHEINAKGFPQDVPDSITLSIADLGIGEMVYAKDLTKDYPIELSHEDEGKVIVKCQHSKVVEITTTTTQETAEADSIEVAAATETDEKQAA